MSETTSAPTQPASNGHAMGYNGTEGQQAEQELNYRLKSAIDSRGRYAYRLADMAAGFAAGRGTNAMEAKAEIETGFTETFGLSPQEYLDRHYEKLRETSEKKTQARGRRGR